MSLKSVKTKIRSIDKTRQVTKAMESVAAVKMRKSQQVALAARPFALAALRMQRTLAGQVELREHPLAKVRTEGKTLIIVVSSDKGLAGSYVSTLFKSVYRMFDAEGYHTGNVELITIGKKAYEHFQKRGYTIVSSYQHWSDAIQYSDVAPLADIVRDAFISERVARVRIVYTNFVSTLRQEVKSVQLLPLHIDAITQAVADITPATGKYAARLPDTSAVPASVVFEPTADAIVADLLVQLFQVQLFHAVLEANASEHSARMIAMKNASDNAKEISRALKLQYNKARQAAITREVSEIVGGMESMRIID